MGKLRAAKKSRGHYTAKKEVDLDEHNSTSTSNLETITLRTKDKSFSSVKSKSSNTEKSPVQPISNDLLKKDYVSPSPAESSVLKKGISKKDRRAARRQQWIKKLSNYQPPDKKEAKKEPHKINDMQSLVDALPSLHEMGGNKKKVGKFTKKTLDAEIKNFVQVLEHPAFKKDPLGTIHLHLTNARKRGLI